LDELDERMRTAVQKRCEMGRHQLATLSATLNALSPLAVLDRGYSLTKRMDNGELLSRANRVQPGDRISTLLAEGHVISEVIEVESDDTN